MPGLTSTSSRGKKRGRSAKTDSKATTSKKAKVTEIVREETHAAQKPTGLVLTLGEGDVGQLGLGPDIMERKKPAVVPELPETVVQVSAGGMHTAVLLDNGQVWTFGCNDDGALGRLTPDEDEALNAAPVTTELRFKQISTGDSHTAGLTHEGAVYIWGTFRDANGIIGLQPELRSTTEPTRILPKETVSKICSGNDHLACLTTDGRIFTLGNGEQGQLGRVAECFSVRGGRKGLDVLLTPAVVRCKKNRKNIVFKNIWTGSYVTFAQGQDAAIFAWGLNNYFQLGIADMVNRFVPEFVKTFSVAEDWQMLSGGQHHSLALSSKGEVYAFGRREYGRLGLGENCEETSSPTLVSALTKKRVVSVSCGSAVSFAVTENGELYAWGMGSNKQLGQKEEDDIWVPELLTGKQLEERVSMEAAAGGQHTVILARTKMQNGNGLTNGH